MKRIITFILFVTLGLGLKGQGLSNFTFSLEEVTINNMPGLQSYAWAKTTDGKWLLLCGRTDGLHDHRPPFSFPANLANDDIWVVDPASKQIWSSPINSLNNDLKNALTASNVQFEQVGDLLYLIGGYGVDYTTNSHKTYPYITAVSVTDLANAIINGQPIGEHFKQISDSRFQVTGGYLHAIANQLYLVGGHDFNGRYNPHNGPSFTQTYTEAIKRFQLDTASGTIQVLNYTSTTDAINLHRRDYNLVPQIFANGDTGLTVFSGVFQPGIDIPYLNTIDITDAGHTVRNGFNQMLNQYHTANMPLYDASGNKMHTVFFGGIGMYYFNSAGTMITDSLVPFVKTISMATRFGNDSMVEYNLPIQMPGYLGASAEFIPSDSMTVFNGILDLNSANGKVLAGYVVGGIESTAPNIFMNASAGTSNASNRIFKVYLQPGSFGTEEQALAMPFQYNIFPNPASEELKVTIYGQHAQVELIDDFGRILVRRMVDSRKEQNEVTFDVDDLATGIYFIRIMANNRSIVEQVVIK